MNNLGTGLPTSQETRGLLANSEKWIHGVDPLSSLLVVGPYGITDARSATQASAATNDGMQRLVVLAIILAAQGCRDPLPT